MEVVYLYIFHRYLLTSSFYRNHQIDHLVGTKNIAAVTVGLLDEMFMLIKNNFIKFPESYEIFEAW